MKRLSLALASLLVALAFVAGSAQLASNTVPTTHSLKRVTTRTVSELLPPDCAGMSVTNYVLGITGTIGGDIVMGTANVDNMDGNKGDDCIMAGGGNDALVGGLGYDVCIGGPGTDTFNNSCEVKVQ